jgi:RimJ/RimL family protein N-acetyltransferase
MLRPPLQADLTGFAKMQAEEESMRYLGGVTSVHGAWRMMAAIAGSWSLLGFGMFSLIARSDNRWIGRVGPWRPGGNEGGWPGNEVGWGLLESERGKGYAYEAAVASIDWAFSALGWDEVVHVIEPDNRASVALAERLGSRFLRTATLPPPISVETDVYGQTREAWQTRKR